MCREFSEEELRLQSGESSNIEAKSTVGRGTERVDMGGGQPASGRRLRKTPTTVFISHIPPLQDFHQNRTVCLWVPPDAERGLVDVPMANLKMHNAPKVVTGCDISSIAVRRVSGSPRLNASLPPPPILMGEPNPDFHQIRRFRTSSVTIQRVSGSPGLNTSLPPPPILMGEPNPDFHQRPPPSPYKVFPRPQG
ncbi:hypothetical protein DFH09DRAFT_1095553 [Mycena vulgaris]|nr:hypothetical protein DFH09DRAFT_1095553 [Mycena vulgaris]